MCAPIIGGCPDVTGRRWLPRMAPVSSVLVIASYLFVERDDGAALRAPLQPQASATGLKATALFAAAGINRSLAAAPAAVEGRLQGLHDRPASSGSSIDAIAAMPHWQGRGLVFDQRMGIA